MRTARAVGGRALEWGRPCPCAGSGTGIDLPHHSFRRRGLDLRLRWDGHEPRRRWDEWDLPPAALVASTMGRARWTKHCLLQWEPGKTIAATQTTVQIRIRWCSGPNRRFRRRV